MKDSAHSNEPPSRGDEAAAEEAGRSDSSVEEGAGEFDRSDWRCLECDYSLAHTVDDRCPECGAWFAPADMAAMALDRALPSYPWEERPGWQAWQETCELVVLRGDEFVGRMSLVPDVVAALQFSLRSNAVAVAGPALLACLGSAFRLFDAPEQSVSVLTGTLMIGAIWSSTRLALEFVLVALFRLGLTPRGRRNGTAVWAALVHYHSAHAVLTSIVFLVGSVLAGFVGLTPGGSGLIEAGGYLVIFVLAGGQFIVGMMWFANVLTCAHRLSRPTAARSVTLAVSTVIMLAMVVVSILGVAATFGVAIAVLLGRS
ncbi:MAG: hypothetical protein SF069_01115 [Phycisphaerae bacterium]|nr:hypothetical protein [Phycisphaerae bacterium]